jgi:hypothetical protein
MIVQLSKHRPPWSRAVFVGVSLVVTTLFVGCGPGGGGPKVEVDAGVTTETLVSLGAVATYPGYTHDGVHIEPSMSVNLAIPDGSKVLQFKKPIVDIAFYCAGSAHSVTGISCYLRAGQGERSFTFSHSLTSQQQQTFQKVVVKRIYEGMGG